MPKTLEGRVGTRLEANSVLYTKMAKGPVDSIKSRPRKSFGRLFTLVGKSLTGLVTNFSQSKDQVSGPLAIVAVGAEVLRKDISGLFQFCACYKHQLSHRQLAAVACFRWWIFVVINHRSHSREENAKGDGAIHHRCRRALLVD